MKRAAWIVLVAFVLPGAAPPLRAGVDLVALRTFFEGEKNLFAGDGKADLVLARESRGDESLFRDVMVEVTIGTAPEPARLRFRLREALVPQGERHLHMPVDLKPLRLEPGTYSVTVRLDSADTVPETDEMNNTVRTTLTIGQGSAARPRGGATTRRASLLEASSLLSSGDRGWTDPLEVGYHPGYGSSRVLLRFRHPLGGAERLKPVLHLTAERLGRPFEKLGPMEVYVRKVPPPDVRCPRTEEIRVTVPGVAGLARIDLAADTECAEFLEILLSFPAPTAPGGEAHLLRIDGPNSRLDFQPR